MPGLNDLLMACVLLLVALLVLYWRVHDNSEAASVLCLHQIEELQGSYRRGVGAHLPS